MQQEAKAWLEVRSSAYKCVVCRSPWRSHSRCSLDVGAASMLHSCLYQLLLYMSLGAACVHWFRNVGLVLFCTHMPVGLARETEERHGHTHFPSCFYTQVPSVRVYMCLGPCAGAAGRTRLLHASYTPLTRLLHASYTPLTRL